MLRFFRKIRQSLLAKHHFGKYVLYAIGEILLVVIGILIALQVDNWNEDRADLAYQEAVLDEIRKALESDIERYRENIQLAKRIDSGVTGLVRLMELDTEGLTEKDFYSYANQTIQEIGFTYNAGAYEGLKASGLEKIRNPGLRSDIINYFEVTLPSARDNIQEYLGTFAERQMEIRDEFLEEGIVESIFVQHPDSLVTIGLNIDFQRMLTHRHYAEYLKNNMWKSLDYRRLVSDMIGETESLIREIEVELNPE